MFLVVVIGVLVSLGKMFWLVCVIDWNFGSFRGVLSV